MNKLKSIFNNILDIYDKIALSTQIIIMLGYLMFDDKLTSLLISNIDKEGFNILYSTVFIYNVLGLIIAFFAVVYWIRYLIYLMKKRRCEK